MKNLKKFIIPFLCIAAACLMLGGCEKTSSQIEAESMQAIREANLEDVRTYTENYFAATMKGATYEAFKSYTDQGQQIVSLPFDNDWGYRWGQFTEKHGAVKEANVDLVDKTDEGFSARIILTGEDEGQMAFTIQYDKALRPVSTSISDYSDDSEETLGSKMAKAGVNTVTGILVVFVILILLSLIISCFKFLNRAQEVAPEKKDAKASQAKPAAPVKAAPAAEEEISLAGNEELVAVIAAAIAAAEDKPPEGYVVRSIRRLHNNKWR